MQPFQQVLDLTRALPQVSRVIAFLCSTAPVESLLTALSGAFPIEVDCLW